MLPGANIETERRVKRNICIYNTAIAFIVLAYFVTFLAVFFMPTDFPVDELLAIEVAFRVTLEVIYAATVFSLYRKLKFFPQDSMRQEIRSILFQFFSFFIGWTLEMVYEILQIFMPSTTFIFACFNITVVVFSFVQPICQMLYSHHKTFRRMPE